MVYLLKVTNSIIVRWAEFLKKIIYDKQRGLSKKSTFPYVPKYILEDESIADMPKEGAKLTKSLRAYVSTFNLNGKKIELILLDKDSMCRLKFLI